MKSKVIYIAIIVAIAGFLAWALVTHITNKQVEDIEQVVQSVCLTSGYHNWYKVRQNPDGSHTVWCFNYDWETVTFEW